MDVNKHERLSIFTPRHKPKGKVMELKYVLVQQMIDIWTVVIVWYLDLQLPVKSVPIITKVVSSNPVHDMMRCTEYHIMW